MIDLILAHFLCIDTRIRKIREDSVDAVEIAFEACVYIIPQEKTITDSSKTVAWRWKYRLSHLIQPDHAAHGVIKLIECSINRCCVTAIVSVIVRLSKEVIF